MINRELFVKNMEEQYHDEIEASVVNTKVYDDSNVKAKKLKQNENNNVSLIESDTASAIFKFAGGDQKVCALNFASFTNPGGGFLLGSNAQEEALCGTSTLYNVLSKFESYYLYNRAHKNNGLYENRALYSPNVIFKNANLKVKCDVLTCAAPNRNSFVELGAENKKALKERIKFVLNIIAMEKPDVVILGAFGCGAFGQNPKSVANYFYKMIDEYIPEDIQVVFAIPQSFSNDNYDVFAEEMLKYSK